MLSIQPKFTNSSAHRITFKADDTDYIIDEKKYNEKKSYYEDKKNNFEESIGDKYIPSKFKKVLRAGVAVSEGVLEGWAVTWASVKFAGFIKDGYKKLKDGKLTKEIKDVFAPLTKGIKQVGKNIKKTFDKGINSVKTSKVATNFVNWVEKLDKNKAGHILVESVKFVGKTFKKAGTFITKAAKALVKPFKKMTYTKATNAAAATFGIGCGVMGTYNALRAYAKKDSAEKAKVSDKTEKVPDEVDELDEEMAEG